VEYSFLYEDVKKKYARFSLVHSSLVARSNNPATISVLQQIYNSYVESYNIANEIVIVSNSMLHQLS
jgi:hypothetical protein